MRDVELAHGVGGRGVLVLTGYGRGEYELHRQEWPRQPDFVAEDISEAVDAILRGILVSAERGTDAARLIGIVEQFRRQAILVLGDFVADEFVFGEISRVSREAPVLILRRREMHTLPGGGANAANNLADLGARVHPVATMGDDAAGDALAEYFRGKEGRCFGTGPQERLDDSREDAISRRLAAYGAAAGVASGPRAGRIARRHD